MFEPDPQKLSIRNENVMRFQESFFYFAHLLRYTPALTWVSTIIILFTYLQLLMSTLAPMVIYKSNNDSAGDGPTSFITSLFYFFIHFSFEEIKFDDYNYLTFVDTIFIFVILSFSAVMYWMFRKGYRFPWIISSIRGLLFFFSPVEVFVPIIFHFCAALHAISGELNSKANITTTMIFTIIDFFIYYALSVWASPLLLQTPLLSMAHVPSHLLPDLTHINSSILYVFAMSFSVCSKTKSALIFFIAFSIAFGVYQYWSILKYPYTSIFDTVMTMSISLSMILNPLIFMIPYFGEPLSDGAFIGSVMGAFVVFLIISYIICIYRQNRILQMIQTNNFDGVKGEKLFVYVQTALLFGEMTPTFVQHIASCYKEAPRNDLLIVYCYCFILTTDQLETDILDQPLTALIHVSTLSWPEKFIVFELYRSFAQTMTLPVPIPKIAKVELLVEKYRRTQEKFWAVMTAGRVNEGVRYLHKMKNSFLKASRTYEQLRQFYRFHPKVIQLELNFFMPRRRHIHPEIAVNVQPNLTCDIQQRYSRFIKRQTMSYDMRKKEDTTTTTLSSTTDSRTMTQISNNLHKFLERPLPAYFYIIGVLAYLMIVATFSVLAYPVFGVKGDAEFLSLIPKSFNRMRQITLQWSNLNIGIRHLSDCTEYVNSDCAWNFKEIGIPFREPNGIVCKTVKDLVYSLGATAIDMHTGLEFVSETMTTFNKNDDLEKLLMSWYEPKVYTFPSENTSSDTTSDTFSMKNNLYRTKIDLRSAIVLYTGHLILLNPDNVSNKCASQYAEFTRADKDNFFNISTTLQIDLYKSLQGYRTYIESIRGEYSEDRGWLIYFLVSLFIVLSILFTALFIYLREKHSYNVLKRHFRPNKNPYTDKAAENLEKVQKFRFRFHHLIPVIWCIFIHLIFLIQFFFMYKIIIETRGEIMNECEAIIEIGNVTLHSSLEIVSLLRYFENPYDIILEDNLNEVQSKLIDAITMMTVSISPLNIRRLWNADPLLVESERCIRIGDSNFSIHDVESCWPVSRQASVIFFYALCTPPANQTIGSPMFTNVQHLYLTHLMDDFATIAEDFATFSQITSCELSLFCMIEIGFYLFFFILTFIYWLYIFLAISSLDQQISRIYQVLIPKFIASQKCLMDFIISEREETENKKTTIRSFFSVYNDAGLAVLVITDRMMIVTFTHGVQTLFGYRAEQLIGQPLSILIPKAMSSNVSHNSSSFYEQLASIRKRQADPVFTRDLLGRSSDGNEIQLHVRTSLAEVEDLDFFVVECKSMSDIFYYDVLIQKHKDVFDETVSMSVPKALFPEMNDEDQYAVAHYDDFILLYAMSPRSEGYSSLSVGMDLSEIKAKVESVVPYFDGSSGAVVLDVSCSHVCILFVDYVGDPVQLFNDAWQFLMGFLSVDSSIKAGLMLKGAEIDIVLFAPPQVPPDFAEILDPIEEAKKLIPTMTVEPFAPLFNDVPAIIEILEPNKLLLSKELTELIEYVEFTKVTTDLPYELMAMDIATDTI